MRLSIKYLLGCLALLFLLPACKGNDEIEEATLDLSTETLTFAKEGSEQSVTISTNKESWLAFSTQEAWLSVEQQGSTLKVKATANEQGRDRAASVIVNAGGLQKRISVKQSAADILLELGESTLSFPVTGGQKKVAYSSNGSDTKVELATPVDWLTIDKVTANSFVLSAKQSTDKHRRQVKVIVSSGTTIREVEVTQEGTLQYVLPLLKVPASLAEVARYENARGHVLVKTPDGLFNTTTYRFLTQNKEMSFIQYEFKGEDAAGYTSAATICTDVKLIKDNPDFEAFLREQTFEKANVSQDGNTITYRSKTIPLEIALNIKPAGVIITVTYVPIQDKDYPTFKSFPMANRIAFLGSRELQVPGKKRADVHTAEQDWGGVLDKAISTEKYEHYKGSDTEYRGYFFIVASKDEEVPEGDPYIDVCQAIKGYYADLSLGLWIDPLGTPHPTREIVKLLGDEGFKFFRTLKNGAPVFINRKKDQALALVPIKIEGKVFLSIEMFLFHDKSEDGGNSLATLQNYRSYLKSKQIKQAEGRRLESYVAKLFRRH